MIGHGDAQKDKYSATDVRMDDVLSSQRLTMP